ncbi:MAG: helix-turn-helix domain-containing protein [Blastocatellia bacterium]|nr:helix-turn-helix domain-containing protein [Blastocatellia bacterium]
MVYALAVQGLTKGKCTEILNTSQEVCLDNPNFTVLDRIIEALKLDNSAQVAKRFGLSRATVLEWGKNSIPRKETLLGISEQSGVSIHWILTGEGPKFFDSEDSQFLKNVTEPIRDLIERVAREDKRDFESEVRELLIEALTARGLIAEKFEPAVFEWFHEMGEIPLVGWISAGKPMTPYQTLEMIPVPKFMERAGNFAVRVIGESMKDMNIASGDILICQKNGTLVNGRTVIALVDGDLSTVKHYFKENGKIRLQPANPDVEPIIRDPEFIEIQAIVLTVTKKL